jgi:hypothetical protein
MPCSPQANYTDLHVVSATDSTAVYLDFLDRSRYFLQISPNYPHDAEWTPFQTHYFSENLVATGM